MSARRTTTSLVAAGALLASAATAGPATAATYPSISKITPMQVQIGGTLTITGTGFLKGKGKNTVVFRRAGQRSIFAKADGLTTTRLRVVVPAKLAPVMGKRAGAAVASKFQLRVLSRRFGKSYTALKLSPVILPAAPPAAPAGTAGTPGATPLATGTPAAAAAPDQAPAPAPEPAPPVDTDGDGTPDVTDADDDDDLLLDATEAVIGTDPLYKDTDGDGMEDGWEYKAATDLKARSCQSTDDYPVPCDAAMPDPAPGGHYYPNPLDPTDRDVDFDGDSLTASEEHAGWLYGIKRGAATRTLTTLWYSDGLQASIDTAPEPNLCRGMAVPEVFDGNGVRPEFARRVTPLSPLTYPDVTLSQYDIYTLDNVGRHAGDGCLDDAERDEDGDFLNNFTEQHGPMMDTSWWAGVYAGENPFGRVTYPGTNWLDPNTDKRGPVDGLDDQDHDDFLNVEEAASRGPASRTKDNKNGASRAGLWTQPFNPCLPSPESRTCPTTWEIGEQIAAPFRDKDGNPPGGARWPLFGGWIYDPLDPAPLPADQTVDTTPPEAWSPPVAYTQTLPPVHPLPR